MFVTEVLSPSDEMYESIIKIIIGAFIIFAADPKKRSFCVEHLTDKLKDIFRELGAEVRVNGNPWLGHPKK